MKELKIVEVEKDGWYEYHIESDGSRFLEYSTQYNVNLELFWDGGGLSEEDIKKNYHFNGSHFSDDYLLYYRIIQSFLIHPTNYVICFEEGEEVERAMDTPFEVCLWKYEFEYLFSRSKHFMDWGFLEPKEFLLAARWQQTDNRKYYLKRMASFDILKAFKLLSSNVTSWNFFSLSSGEESGFLETIQGTKRPELLQVLGESAILIVLQLGLDEGHCDYMLIKSRKRLKELAHKIEVDINERGKLYEERLKEVYYWEFYPYLLKELFDLPLIES